MIETFTNLKFENLSLGSAGLMLQSVRVRIAKKSIKLRHVTFTQSFESDYEKYKNDSDVTIKVDKIINHLKIRENSL